MPSPADFQLLAKYNQWMNNKVYNAAATLTQADFTEYRGAYFGSVSGREFNSEVHHWPITTPKASHTPSNLAIC